LDDLNKWREWVVNVGRTVKKGKRLLCSRQSEKNNANKCGHRFPLDRNGNTNLGTLQFLQTERCDSWQVENNFLKNCEACLASLNWPLRKLLYIEQSCAYRTISVMQPEKNRKQLWRRGYRLILLAVLLAVFIAWCPYLG